MPIAIPPCGTLEIVEVDDDIVDIDTPLSWSTDRETRRELRKWTEGWLRAHPFRVNDEPEVVVAREVCTRIIEALIDYPVHRDVNRAVIMRQINNDTRIVGQLRDDCLWVFDQVWCAFANMLKCTFTKLPPDDDC